MKGELQYIVGHNDEACCLLNSVCAERAAFLQLASIRGNVVVHGVFLVSDASRPITPGALCREFMMSSAMTTPSMPVVMEGNEGPKGRIVRTLEEMWPLASPYTRLDAAGQEAAGVQQRAQATKQLAALLAKGSLEAKAWRLATEAARNDKRSEMHPVSFGSSVLFADGTPAIAWQKKALEYGCTLDAICQLAPALEAARTLGTKPLLIVMADQFGVCHAPFAPARAFLVEHGFGAVQLLVHDTAGTLHRTTADELMPALPGDKWC